MKQRIVKKKLMWCGPPHKRAERKMANNGKTNLFSEEQEESSACGMMKGGVCDKMAIGNGWLK